MAGSAPSQSRVRSVEGPCRIFLVRHGTARVNAENRYRGRWDVPLDVQGYEDAVDAARALSGVRLSAVYAGPLRRTIATAQIIADQSGIPDIRILQQLTNVDYGMWHGMTAAEAEANNPKAFGLYCTSPLECACPNGERLVDAQERMVEALQLIGVRHPGENVAGVTHSVMIRLLVARVAGISGRGWRLPVSRDGIVELHVEDGSVRLVTPLEDDEATSPVAPAGIGISEPT